MSNIKNYLYNGRGETFTPSSGMSEYSINDIDEKSGRIDTFTKPTKRDMTTSEYLEFVAKTMSEMQDLIRRKNADYTNGAGPFANFKQAEDYGVDPFHGLMVRVGDKMQRIKSFCKQGKLEVKDEGIEDALKDLIGYSLIGLGMLHERK